MIVLENPSELKLIGWDNKEKELLKVLTYRDKSVEYSIKKFTDWWKKSSGDSEYYTKRINELKADLYKNVLWRNPDDTLGTYSGLLDKVKELSPLEEVKYLYGAAEATNPLFFEETRKINYRLLTKESQGDYRIFNIIPRAGQVEAFKAILDPSHDLRLPRSVNLSAGSGKTLLLALIINHFYTKTLVMVPSIAIAKQLVGVFRDYFGKHKVGIVGNSENQYDRMITVALGQSLTRLKPNTPQWKAITENRIFLSDECHTNSVDTFEKVCVGVCKDIPFRCSVTATPERNDGSDIKLNGLIGKIVYERTFKEAVEAGDIATPTFFYYKVKSPFKPPKHYLNVREMHKHWYKNINLHKLAADLANRLVKDCNQKVLIAIDHIEQFKLIHEYFRHEYGFAHGNVTGDRLPKNQRKNNVEQLVKDFNAGKFPILIGTGVLGIGVDTKQANTVINLQFGASRVKFTQLVGRGARVTDTKKTFNFIDFDIDNISFLHNQFIRRITLYRELYDNIQEGLF